MRRKILCLIPALLLIFSLSAAWATPMAEVKYFFEGQSGGFWKYEFIVSNNADPITDPGFDIYELMLKLGEVPGLSEIKNPGLPADWDSSSDTGTSLSPGAFIFLYSLLPGVPPGGADIAPGTSLGGFIFEFNAELDKILFETFMVNPADPDNPIQLAENDATPGNAVPIPEPATLALVCVGLAGMGLYTRRKRIH